MIFPESTLVDKKIPKKRFYENSKIKPELKKRFVDEISSVVLTNKISEDTINVKGTKDFQELLVIKIVLKSNARSDKLEDLLKLIDRSIPYLILFEIETGESFSLYKISYKKKSKVSSDESVVEIYFTKEVRDLDEFNKSMKKCLNSLNLERVYNKIIRLFADDHNNTNIENLVEREKRKRFLHSEIERLEKKKNNEKQPDKQFEIFNELKSKKKELSSLG